MLYSHGRHAICVLGREDMGHSPHSGPSLCAETLAMDCQPPAGPSFLHAPLAVIRQCPPMCRQPARHNPSAKRDLSNPQGSSPPPLTRDRPPGENSSGQHGKNLACGVDTKVGYIRFCLVNGNSCRRSALEHQARPSEPTHDQCFTPIAPGWKGFPASSLWIW